MFVCSDPLTGHPSPMITSQISFSVHTVEWSFKIAWTILQNNQVPTIPVSNHAKIRISERDKPECLKCYSIRSPHLWPCLLQSFPRLIHSVVPGFIVMLRPQALPLVSSSLKKAFSMMGLRFLHITAWSTLISFRSLPHCPRVSQGFSELSV